jgi:hypothetical protein
MMGSPTGPCAKVHGLVLRPTQSNAEFWIFLLCIKLGENFGSSGRMFLTHTLPWVLQTFIQSTFSVSYPVAVGV